MSRARGMGAKPFDLAELKEALDDGLIHATVGVVNLPAGQSSHFELSGDDCLVEVQLAPNGDQALCRLACAAGGAGIGVWKVPAVGTEVAVIVPTGELACDPMIIGVLSTGKMPPSLTEHTLVIQNDDEVHIIPKGSDKPLRLGSSDAAQSAIRGDLYRQKEDDFFSNVINALQLLGIALNQTAAVCAGPTVALKVPLQAAGAALVLTNILTPIPADTIATFLATFQQNEADYKSDTVKIK